MYLKLHPTAAAALAAEIIARIDAGSGPATIRLYTGEPPATPAVAISTQTLLGTLSCSEPAAAAEGGTITFAAIAQDAAADASGTAAWARVSDGDGAGVIDVDVTNAAGTGVIKLNTTTIVAGGPIVLSAFVLVIGG